MHHFSRHLYVSEELAIEFIAVFSRMEHALKSSGYVTGDETGVQPAWDRFANQIDQRFKSIDLEGLQDAVEYLLKKPPRKQVMLDDRVEFVDQRPDKHQRRTHQLLNMIRRVRNNLFHGGKYLPSGETDEGRNEKLIKASLLVLQACIDLDEQVKNSFER